MGVRRETGGIKRTESARWAAAICIARPPLTMQQSAWLNHVRFAFLPSHLSRPFLAALPPRTEPASPPSDAFFLPPRPSNAFLFNSFFSSFQMVQAIQVLRFHLLELEKVSIFHVHVRNHSQCYRRLSVSTRRMRVYE